MGQRKAMGHSSVWGAGSSEALLGHSCVWIPMEEREASDSLSARQKLGHPASSHRQAAVAAEPEGMPWVRKLRWGGGRGVGPCLPSTVVAKGIGLEKVTCRLRSPQVPLSGVPLEKA